MDFIKQRYNYGKGNLLTFRKHNDHPALNYLSINFFKLIQLSIKNIFSKEDRIFWQKVKLKIIIQYNISNFGKKILLSFYLQLHKLFYLIGNLRTSICIKFNF